MLRISHDFDAKATNSCTDSLGVTRPGLSFEPELNRQSAKWLGDGSPQPTKAIESLTLVKAMHIVFFDVLLIDHAVPTDMTVNGDYYAKFIRHHLRPAIRKKRPDMLREGPITLHDIKRCGAVADRAV